MREIKVGDRLVLNSSNGMTYKVIVKNVNEFRPPETKYAVNIIDENGNSYYDSKGDLYFCGDDFMDKCELIKEEV